MMLKNKSWRIIKKYFHQINNKINNGEDKYLNKNNKYHSIIIIKI